MRLFENLGIQPIDKLIILNKAKKKPKQHLNLPEKTRDVLASLEHLTSPIDTKLKTSSKLNRSKITKRNLPPVGWRQHTPKKAPEKHFNTSKSLNVTLAEEKEIYEKTVASIKAKSDAKKPVTEKETKG